MGLSGRRRARKETRTGGATPATLALDPQPHQRSGNTHRRVGPASARDRKHTNLLGFQLNRGWRNDLLPAKPVTHPEIGAEPNANLYSRDMLRIMDNDYNSNITYSLNKQKRWRFTRQLMNSYQDKEDLKAQNIFLVESVARGSNGAVATKLVTNASYITDAAAELRDHKKNMKLRAKSTHAPKKLIEENDRFQFSEQVKQDRTERPLTSFSSATQAGPIDYKSIRHTCNHWNRLYDVSPRAEEVRLEMQRDYDGRMEVVVGTCVPCPGVDIKRCRQVEKDIRSEEPKVRMTRKLVNHLARVQQRCDLALQLEMDGDTDFVLENAAEESDIEELKNSTFDGSAVTLFDAMLLKDCAASVNRAKKQLVKARKLKKLKALQSHRKTRNDSNETVASSGYDSGSESRAEDRVEEAAEKEKEVVDARLVEAVEAALSAERHSVRVPREAADDTQLISLFADCEAEHALVVSSSLPRKLAVVLQPDLSETVVFEEAVAQEDPAFTSFAVHHICSENQSPRTSTTEVLSQVNPFAFLRSLVVSTRIAHRPAQVLETKSSGFSATSWTHAEVLPEPDARMTAIRALPMFSALAGDADRDAELVPRSECEICCQQLDTELRGSGSFAVGSTMLIQCGHSFCNRCWLQHVASSVARGRVDISCPGYRCQAMLDAATLLWFCPGMLLPALSAAAFRAWLADRRQGRQRRFCPRRNCGVLESSVGVNAKCGVCSGSLCLCCGQEPHWPIDCATAAGYRTKMQRLGHTKLSLCDLNSEVDVSAKQCPTCHLVMEKGIGCNHMSCPCGEHFCWWCGEPMRTHSSGPCYSASSSGRDQSSYRVQRVFTAADSLLVPSSSQSRIYCEAVKIRLHRESPRLRSMVANSQTVTDLFLSYAIRFRVEGRDNNWQRAGRYARETAQRLIAAAIEASYLAEYAFAHLDSHRWDRRVKAAVRAIGDHVSQLAASIISEMEEQCRRGYLGPKKTKLGCERLLMMEKYLQGKCRMLHGIVVRHRDIPLRV